tara:strand:- start:16 stop:621 length:606 start_codon:yes stop_codon:yes gene_type:complete
MGNKVKARDYTLANNPYAHIHFGPSGEPSKKGEDLNTCMTTLLRSGHSCIFTNDGNKGEVNPGSSHEICGTELARGRNDSEKEAIAKSIYCENGDLVLEAPNGNVKILAQNLYVETAGADSDGSILMKANDHIVLKADEQINIAGGKVCVTSSDSITINAKGTFYTLYSDIEQGSPLNSITEIFKISSVTEIIKLFANTCG